MYDIVGNVFQKQMYIHGNKKKIIIGQGLFQWSGGDTNQLQYFLLFGLTTLQEGEGLGRVEGEGFQPLLFLKIIKSFSLTVKKVSVFSMFSPHFELLVISHTFKVAPRSLH